MNVAQYLRSSALLLASVLVLVGCSDSPMTSSDMSTDGSSDALTSVSDPAAATSGSESSAMDRATVYRADLQSFGGSGVTGEAEILVKGDKIAVSVNAEGLEADIPHAQHIHMNAQCGTANNIKYGGIFLTLDDDLSNAPAEGGGSNPDMFPTATHGGTINYRAQDSKSAIEAETGALELEGRTIVLHAESFAPVACGSVDQVGS